MNQQLQIWNYNDTEIKTILIEGNIWFYAKDICDFLTIKNIHSNLETIPTDWKRTIKDTTVCNTYSGQINDLRTIINEAAFFQLVFRSRKPTVQKFIQWVSSEVLPTLRKTGKFEIPGISQELKKESTENRNSLTSQWKEHGAEKKHHYINLTRAEYDSLGFQKGKTKKEMTEMELIRLKTLENLEFFKLMGNKDIEGYYALKDSIKETAQALENLINKKQISA